MFAPYCSTCASRVLLTTRRIVRFTSEETGLVDVVLRCYCGTEVSADATAPHATPLPAVSKPQAVPAARVLTRATAAAAS
ncbi:hypothetical protein [Sporichthya sp.]|uniref:hypothetical protein n=1 Tax=Sporichthya sp. TaxID=65475 RepID=UPI0018281455|nr:hypothetical protein [Sporichthya sp.]MBA3743864.1 hypothetical protein [Sporichthya sp.]